MARVILTGNDSEVEKIIRENRIRVERGMVMFTSESNAPEKEITVETKVEKQGRKHKDSKEVSVPSDSKEAEI